MSFKLYVDDVRPAPTGWQLARNVTDAKKFLSTGNVDWLSLDYDLGPSGETGMQIVRYIIDSGRFPTKVIFHTANSPGLANMKTLLLRYGPYRVVSFRELEKV